MELSFQQKLFYFFPVLFCFCLPFGSLVLSVIIILWGLTSFLNIDKSKLKAGFYNKNFWLLALFFFVTCISAAFSNNKTEALTSIENKLGFLVLPYYFFCFSWPSQIIKKCMVSFVSGCFFACMYLIFRAAAFAFNGHPEHFFYTAFSDLIHTSYFAMYLILAISIVFLYYHEWFSQQKQYTYISAFFIAVFTITIFLCYSKMGIITFFICLPVLIFYRWRSIFNFKKAILLFAGVTLLMVVAVKLFPGAFNRLNSITSFSMDSIDKTSSESTTVRVLIWEQCLSIIKNNFLFGVTVGDANDALYKAYEQNGLTGALEHKLNAHNQYFQTFIGLGMIGFLLLSALTFGQFIKAVLRKNILLLIFSILIVLNFVVESMLQRADGILFFVFFFCLFNLDKINDEISS
jgi:O-antigen ligase